LLGRNRPSLSSLSQRMATWPFPRAFTPLVGHNSQAAGGEGRSQWRQAGEKGEQQA
jgi:hypothetical protein